ncbi:hypothetical protein [Bartonella sp. AP11XZML]|uniref:hypothetical protein n=1 Tax=Bartonella sp. AP11XZML TaxID=3243465 RepID=UPI0035CEE5FB
MGSGALGKGGRWQEGWVWICLGECGACLVLFGACVWGDACWGACVEGECQRVCFSLSFFEMALLMVVCQEHGKWCLGKRRTVARRVGVDLPWRVWCMLGPVWGMCLGGCLLGCLCGGGVPKSLLFIEFF